MGPANRCLRTISWLLGRVARLPATWIATPGFLVYMVWLHGLADLGITTHSARNREAWYEVAMVAGAVATCLAFGAADRQAWLAPLLSRSERFVTDLAVLVVCLGLAWAAAWAPGLAVSSPWPPSCPPGGLGATGAALAHLTALGLLVSRLPMPTGPRCLLMVSLVWWIPALLADRSDLLGDLARWGAGPIAVLGPASPQTQTLGAVDMAPTVAFGLAAWLLTPGLPRS